MKTSEVFIRKFYFLLVVIDLNGRVFVIYSNHVSYLNDMNIPLTDKLLKQGYIYYIHVRVLLEY